ncbi:unnamed protein product [Colletotrichum noveboracense]|uniref:Uncharacterized protein n=1 Tax=Colletotrichum noveboracense TaxID=2664923 RepID=A0A9W4RI53_9PEZI|nr:hypothetical protein K456DRAFT_1937399 [Colletotrichum gloeosporioides 23]CAI0641570.1 unnamed protein product [Colletotrichum noveboracense]
MPPHQYRHQFNDTYPAAPVKEDCSALDSDLLVGVVIPPFFAMGFLVSLVITLWNRWTYITRTKKLEEENRRLRVKNQLNEYWHGPISDDLVDAELKDPGSHTGGAKRPESGSDHVRDVDRDGGTQSRLATYDDAGFYVSGGRDGADQEESEESRERSRDLSTIAEETEVSADAVLRSIPDEPDHRFAVGSDSDEDEWERAEPDYMAGGGESSIPLEPLKRVASSSKYEFNSQVGSSPSSVDSSPGRGRFSPSPVESPTQGQFPGQDASSMQEGESLRQEGEYSAPGEGREESSSEPKPRERWKPIAKSTRPYKSRFVEHLDDVTIPVDTFLLDDILFPDPLIGDDKQDSPHDAQEQNEHRPRRN